MKLNLENIKKLDSKQILKLLLPTIDNLYKTFDYIGITKEEFYKIVLNDINKSKKEYIGNIDYTEYIKNRIGITLVNQIEENTLKQKTAVIIINNYINKHLKKSFVYEDSIRNLKKLDAFFKTYNYIPNPDVMIQVIEGNSEFSKMIESIIKKCKTQVSLEKFEEIFDENTIILAIEIYCMLNNIEIKKSEEIEIDSFDRGSSELTNSVKIYLKEIARRPLLSFEEEKELALKISQGDSNARKIFIESNLKLVVSIARKYIGRGLPFLDLIQEGNIGLMTAVDRYDVNRGLKFSTYATYWIRQAIIRSLANNGRNIRIPVYLFEKMSDYKKAIANLETKLNREPTINEIATEMGLSILEITKINELQIDTVSLNTLIDDDKKTELEAFIPSFQETPEDVALESDIKYQVRKLLEDCKLKSKEIEVLMLRFGLNGTDPMTLKAIGEKLGVTRERARQIEAKALMKIRKSTHIKALANYMEKPEECIQNLEVFKEEYIKTGNYNKAYLRKYNQIQEMEENEMQKLKTIYEYFNSYSKEQVDAMLEKLTSQEKELIKLRYGSDLNNPVNTKLSKEETSEFYNILIPKMKKLLVDPNYERKVKKRKTGVNESIINNSIESLNKTKEEDPNEIIPVVGEVIKQPEVKIDSESSNIETITKDDYTKILELLKTPSFNSLLNMYSSKTVMIISLKLGYVDGKIFSNSAISEFLGIEESEVRQITLKVLLAYKERINQMIDDTIEIIVEEKELPESSSNKLFYK